MIVRKLIPKKIRQYVLKRNPILIGTPTGRFFPYLPIRLIKLLRVFVHDPVFYLYATVIDTVKEIYLENVYERNYSIHPNDIVIDVGANVGIFTVKSSIKVGQAGKVYAIEPIEENFKLLKNNCDVNNLVNVVCIRKACGSKSGKAIMLKSRSSALHSLKDFGVANIKNSEFSQEEVEVDCETLDNICKELGVSRIDFLKIDVEGAELEVLKGAEESLKITRNIAMELHYEGEDEEVRRFLEERGFTVKIVESMLYASKQ